MKMNKYTQSYIIQGLMVSIYLLLYAFIHLLLALLVFAFNVLVHLINIFILIIHLNNGESLYLFIRVYSKEKVDFSHLKKSLAHISNLIKLH